MLWIYYNDTRELFNCYGYTKKKNVAGFSTEQQEWTNLPHYKMVKEGLRYYHFPKLQVTVN